MVLQEQWKRFAFSSPEPKAEKGNLRVCLTYCCCGGCLWTWVGLIITWLPDTWKSWVVMELQTEARLWNEGLSPSFSTPPSDTSLNSICPKRILIHKRHREVHIWLASKHPFKKFYASLHMYFRCAGIGSFLHTIPSFSCPPLLLQSLPEWNKKLAMFPLKSQPPPPPPPPAAACKWGPNFFALPRRPFLIWLWPNFISSLSSLHLSPYLFPNSCRSGNTLFLLLQCIAFLSTLLFFWWTPMHPSRPSSNVIY